MKNTLFLIGALAVSVTLAVTLPNFILVWIGYYQIGSWVGDIANKLREN
jgi:hypothetical protein